MKKQSVTLKYLKKEVWWWKWKKIRQFGVWGVDWNCVTKDAARNYELMRRSQGGKQFPKTYLELNTGQRLFVHDLWCNLAEHPYQFVIEHSTPLGRGWTHPAHLMQWNLRLADSELVKSFKKFIRDSRTVQRIRPKHPLKGKKNNPISWRYLEILDWAENSVGKLNDSDRHMASVGRKMAARLFRQFRRAMAKWKPAPPLVLSSPNSRTNRFELKSPISKDCVSHAGTSEFLNLKLTDSWQ